MPSGIYYRTPQVKALQRRCLEKGRNNPDVRAKALASIISVWTEEKRMEMSKRMKKRLHEKDLRKKHLASMKGHKGKQFFKGGNGQRPIRIVRRLAKLLCRVGFVRELAVPTVGHDTGLSAPPAYKVDFGHPKKRIAIEVDGPAHKLIKKTAKDIKKAKVLKALGWEVLRLSHD